MKETYSLNDILKFWQRQMQVDFAVIEALVNLMQRRDIEYAKKHETVLTILRNHGWFETGYTGKKIFLIENKQTPLVEVKPSNNQNEYMRNFEVALQLFNIRILNADIQFSMILN